MEKLFKQACWLHLSFCINRYLMSNAEGRYDGAEKAMCHIDLCTFYVAAFHGINHVDTVRREREDEFQAVHEATQELTGYLDEKIGFPLKGRPDYDTLAPLFFETFHKIAMETLSKGRS